MAIMTPAGLALSNSLSLAKLLDYIPEADHQDPAMKIRYLDTLTNMFN